MVAATGIYKQPERMSYLLGASATWQGLVGASTAAEAMQFIHVNGVEEDDTYYHNPPRATVTWQDQNAFTQQRVALGLWSGTGSLTLSIELVVPDEYPMGSADAHNWFMNQIGAIVSEITDNAGVGEPVAGETHLNVTSISRVDGPWYMREDEVQILDPAVYSQPKIMWIVFGIEYM